jgi:DeoR/GlpR family transcriptional regulator of sugar metabolism
VLARLRQDRIVAEVRRRGGIRVSDLTALLDVSDMTIRRDLDRLARLGVLEKVHGGAILAGRSAVEPTFDAKRSREQVEKAAIAVAAAGLVRPGSAIALSAGTTTWSLARELLTIPDLTVVTNSVNVADVLHAEAAADGRTVLLTGGVRTPSNALVGPIADAAIRSLHVDLLFLGTYGMDPDAGLTTPNLVEAQTNRTFVSAARRVVLVADHTKWRTVGLAAFGTLADVDVLVTDEALDAEACGVLKEHVGELVLADPEENR